jgi:hypothetical protein
MELKKTTQYRETLERMDQRHAERELRGLITLADALDFLYERLAARFHVGPGRRLVDALAANPEARGLFDGQWDLMVGGLEYSPLKPVAGWPDEERYTLVTMASLVRVAQVARFARPLTEEAVAADGLEITTTTKGARWLFHDRGTIPTWIHLGLVRSRKDKLRRLVPVVDLMEAEEFDVRWKANVRASLDLLHEMEPPVRKPATVIPFPGPRQRPQDESGRAG